jgi:CubicO group peptidase (beta-lactamase class C family)
MHRTTIITSIVTAALALAPVAALGQTPGGPGSPPPTPTPTPTPTATPPPGDPPAPAPTPPPVGAPTPAPTPVFPAPDGGLALPPPVNTTTFAAQIRSRMKNNAFGWQFAIAQNGKLVPGNNTNDKRAGGFARSDADTPQDGPVPMKNTMRYEVASFTKNPVALETMKLLRLNHLSVDSPIAAWLPPSWKRGKGFGTMKFSHLLSHTSGINQMLAQKQATLGKPKLDTLAGNTWEGLQWIVKQDVVVPSSRLYKNANYGILAILNARLWKAAGGVVIQDGQIAAVKKDTYSAYVQQFNQWEIFTPSGIKNVTCVGNAATDGLNYPAGASQSTKGGLGAWPAGNCAGNAGLRLSSVEMVRYLAHLRHGDIVHPDDLKTMDEFRLGWREATQIPTAPSTVRWHDGAFTGTNQVWTCGMTFPDGTEAAMIVNSPLVQGSACSVLSDAWNAAK